MPYADYQAEPARRLGYYGIDYCRTGYPGNIVGVSPVEPTELGVFGFRT